jgi:hypothetical protein
MIIESQTVKSKSELQTALQKMKIGRAVIYQNIDQRAAKEIVSHNNLTKSFHIIILEK